MEGEVASKESPARTVDVGDSVRELVEVEEALNPVQSDEF